jgi:hypothetical protein
VGIRHVATSYWLSIGTAIRALRSSSIAANTACGSPSTLHASIRSSTRRSVAQASDPSGGRCSRLWDRAPSGVAIGQTDQERALGTRDQRVGRATRRRCCRLFNPLGNHLFLFNQRSRRSQPSPNGLPLGNRLCRIEPVPVVAVTLTPWCSRSVCPAVHTAALAAPHHWRLALSPAPCFGSASLGHLKRQWGLRCSLHEVVLGFR